MKFKQGDTVYLKATIDKIKNTSRGICINLGHDVGYNHCEEYNLFTEQEMLAELTKPEMPKVGEVWECEDVFSSALGKFKVSYIDNNINQIVVKVAGRELRVISTEFMLKHCKKVES